MATKRRTTRRTTTRRRTSGSSLPSLAVPSVTISPDVARSIVGICLLVLGAVTLIALALPGQGALTDWWRDSIAPWFETGRWLLPFLLLGAGWYLEWGPGTKPGSGWGATLLGITLAFVGFLGAFEILNLTLLGEERGGGRIGRFLATTLEPLLTGPGAFVICVAIFVVGLMLAFNLQLRELLHPVTKTANWVGSTAAASLRRENGEPATAAKNGRNGKPAEKPTGGVPVMDPAKPIAPSPLMAGAAGAGAAGAAASILDEHSVPSPQPISQTVVFGDGDGTSGRPLRAAGAVALASRPSTEVDEPPTALEALQAIDWILPAVELLEPRPAGRVEAVIDHESNKRRIEEKLLSFAIPAKVVKVNSGPVVTQYEV
jgi:DNA segregation ATPase FtsK/SpoIIIE, S-DNA-T family